MRVDADIFDPDDLMMLNEYIRLCKTWPYLKWDHVISKGLEAWAKREKEAKENEQTE